MARKAHTKEIIRELFAKSGNQCAFPDCNHPLIDDDGDYVAQICHIEAASEGGERYNERMTDDERAAPSNLLIMCHRHHVKTNNVDIYTVPILQDMKRQHETRFSENQYHISAEKLLEITETEFDFWAEIHMKNQKHLSEFDLAFPIVSKNEPLAHIDEMWKAIQWLERYANDVRKFHNNLNDQIKDHLSNIGYDLTKYDNVKYYHNPFALPMWEMENLGVPNTFIAIEAAMLSLECGVLHTLLRQTPTDQALQDRLDEKKARLADIAEGAILYD
ncbi:hypothetical protein [Terasakiella pusilla]|uniref:hypothetical protein n=1 Tax=Terasakiella pusilla TaxID=64973 RepID=UPI00068E8885|nr:hypothetical protein [Terasakiella pusilla]